MKDACVGADYYWNLLKTLRFWADQRENGDRPFHPSEGNREQNIHYDELSPQMDNPVSR